MIILGVDPGKRTGYSYFDTRRDIELLSGVLDGDDFVFIGRMLKKNKSDLIQIEDQFLGKRRNQKGENRYFADAYAKLRFYAWAWEKVAKTENIKFAKPVNPSTWQSYWKLKKGDKEGMRYLSSILTGKEIEKISLDEADAILIARWAASSLRAEEIIKQAEREVKS